MRRIFPTKSSATFNSNDKRHQVKKESSTSAPSSKKDGPKPKEKSVTDKRSSSSLSRTRREHWCPSERCETPPSGDENPSTFSANVTRDESSESGNRGSISQSRLGLPEECQDKQVLRPSINAGNGRSPSQEPFEWTSGLQAALDELVVESRQELRRKYVSEPPSPSTSPPVLEKRKHVEAVERSVIASSDDDEGEVSSGRLSHPVNLEDNDLVATVSHSMEFESSTSFVPSGRLSRSMSRSSSDGPSILSNPRSHSFSEWSRAPKPSEDFSRGQEDQVTSRDRSHFKYLSARVVAEKLAKAIRGNSKTKDDKRLPPIPQTPSRSSESSGSYNSNNVVRAVAQPEESRVSHQNYFKSSSFVPKVQIDRRPKAECDKNQGRVESGQCKQENVFFRRQLESHKEQINFVYENLSERVCSAEKLLTAAEGELKSSAGFPGEKNAGRLCSRELERQDSLLRRVRKLQKEKNELAREVVSEVRLRNMERLTVREVIELMKRDMEFWIKSLEQDKSDMESRLQQLEGKGFKDKVHKLAEEKTWLEKELVAVTSKESALRQKVREFELQMQAHVTRVEDAERTILDLRESLVNGQKKTIQLEEEGEELRKSYREKESENVDLRKLVLRLQQLCADHEKSIRGLWQSLRSATHDKPDQKVAKLQQELLRMSDVEQTLRHELEASRVEASGLRQELNSRTPEPESDRMKVTLQEHISLLSTKLQESLEFQKKQQKEINALEAARVSLEKQNESLQKKLEQRNEHQMEENGDRSVGQQQSIDGLQQSLTDMNHALSTQNSRIQRLTGRNEELYKLYTSKEKELLELQSKTRERECKRSNDDKQKQEHDKLQNELVAQQRECHMLREKLASTERDLDQCRGELGETSQSRRVLQDEVARLRRLLESSTQRVTELERQLKDREQKLATANAELRQYWHELGKYKEELPRAIRQRDDMKQEAEQLGREALRTSAEAEILRRRVHQLEEEVMIRDGHLSILRGSLENNNDDC